jgi:hypothetical protein
MTDFTLFNTATRTGSKKEPLLIYFFISFHQFKYLKKYNSLLNFKFFIYFSYFFLFIFMIYYHQVLFNLMDVIN